MSILIKDIEMPECCDKCWALNDYGDYPVCLITGETKGYNFRIRERRMDKCPLIEIPTPHGRLIDEKWIKEYITDTTEGFEELIMNRSDLQYYSLIAGLRTVEVMIEHVPTVIEAEE